MAITINTTITGQQADDSLSYCYLYEPLKIRIVESTIEARKLYIDVLRYSSITGELFDSYLRYGEFDINPGKGIIIDLMEFAQQLHKSDLYKYSNIQDFNVPSLQSSLSIYTYDFKVYTDANIDYPNISKLPIIGGRDYSQFNAVVDKNTSLDEFGYYGLNKVELQRRWGSQYFYMMSLPDLSLGVPYIPVVTDSPGGVSFCRAEGGFLYWKSRFGGWLFWGMDIQRKTYNPSYEGQLSSGMFESTYEEGGNIYVPVDYTSISSTYSLELKALSLSKEELAAVSGIATSPAVYFADLITGRFELMRVGSFSAPFSNLANGGDFTVGLNSISKTSIKTK
jgi:hypothetical protein